MFGKMDPFVVITYLGRDYQTKVHESGGKTPIWNHSFDIQLGSINDDIQMKVKDDDMIGSKMIGEANLKASSLCINNGVRDWFKIYWEGKEVGLILLKSEYVPRGG